MTVLSEIRDRFSPSRSEGPSGPAAGTGDALPFTGYDRLNAKQVTQSLSDHSQLELEAVEGYERSHEDRERVLDKLRYMRQREPLEGYDALSVEEITATVREADPATIKQVRGYERKFANRHAVLEEVVRALRLRKAKRARP